MNNNPKQTVEEVEEQVYLDIQELEQLREYKRNAERDKSEELVRIKAQEKIDRDTSDGNTLRATTWFLLILTLIPFFPYKALLTIFGLLTGYIYYTRYDGSKVPMYAHVIFVIARLLLLIAIIWSQIFFLWLVL